jgi:hypothetical protein
LNRQRVCKFVFFGHWSKAKSVVKSGQVGCGSGFQQRFWQAQGCPTKRAADWWDSSRLTGIFLASGFFCSRSESQPAHQRLTQTVGRFSCLKKKDQKIISCIRSQFGLEEIHE